MRILPVNRKSFVHLHVLTGFDASAAENALLRVVAVEGIGMILFVRLGMIGSGLMFDGQHSFGVVNGAVSVVVVAHGAVENVIGENAVKGLALRRASFFGFCRNFNSGGNGSRTCARELPVNLDHAGVTRLD